MFKNTLSWHFWLELAQNWPNFVQKWYKSEYGQLETKPIFSYPPKSRAQRQYVDTRCMSNILVVALCVLKNTAKSTTSTSLFWCSMAPNYIYAHWSLFFLRRIEVGGCQKLWIMAIALQKREAHWRENCCFCREQKKSFPSTTDSHEKLNLPLNSFAFA